MWDNLGTYDQIFRAFLIGILFGVCVYVGYYLMNRRTSKTIENLKSQLEKKHGV